MPPCLGGRKRLTSEDPDAREGFHNLPRLGETFAWCRSFVFAHIKSSEGLHYLALGGKAKLGEPLSQRQEESSKTRNSSNLSISKMETPQIQSMLFAF